MSGVVRSIGKAFKSVVKVVKKVAPIALAVGAVVMTGGAALGLTPTFAAGVGSLVGGLGLSAPLAGALTGSIVSAGFGSAAGGALAGVSGGNVMEGMQKGALTGAVTGGAIGALSPASFGMGAAAKTATGGLMQSAGTAGTAPAGTGGLSSIGSQAAGAVDSALGINTAVGAAGIPAAAAAPAMAAGGGSGGLLSFANKNPLLAGNVISGLAKGLGGNGDGRTYEDQTRSAMDMANFAYKGAYAGRADPFGVAAPLAVPAIAPAYAATKPRWRYDAQTNTVVEDAA